jgi:hypothetical protein
MHKEIALRRACKDPEIRERETMNATCSRKIAILQAQCEPSAAQLVRIKTEVTDARSDARNESKGSEMGFIPTIFF